MNQIAHIQLGLHSNRTTSNYLSNHLLNFIHKNFLPKSCLLNQFFTNYAATDNSTSLLTLEEKKFTAQSYT